MWNSIFIFANMFYLFQTAVLLWPGIKKDFPFTGFAAHVQTAADPRWHPDSLVCWRRIQRHQRDSLTAAHPQPPGQNLKLSMTEAGWSGLFSLRASWKFNPPSFRPKKRYFTRVEPAKFSSLPTAALRWAEEKKKPNKTEALGGFFEVLL